MPHCRFFFFFNDTATTEIYTLSLHDALPISKSRSFAPAARGSSFLASALLANVPKRSEEHTSELQSQSNLVCRLLLEKKKNITSTRYTSSDHSDAVHMREPETTFRVSSRVPH